MKLILLSPLCLLIFLFPPNTSEPILCNGNFCIHYQPIDSLYAKRALPFLIRLQEELAEDLKLTIRDTFHVVIAPSRALFNQMVHGAIPKWSQAVALTGGNMMIVKSPRWAPTEENFNQTLAHELLHLILSERTNLGKIPRWLDEGLAIFYSESHRWERSTALSKAVFTGSVLPLMSIDRVLTFERHRAELAYQQSYSAVKYLLSTYDIEALNIILDGIRNGKTLDQSFLEATGSDFRTFEVEWRRYIEKTQKWFWLSDFYDYLWIVILLLVFISGLIIRIRNRKKVASWEREEQVEFVQMTQQGEDELDKPPLPSAQENLSKNNIH